MSLEFDAVTLTIPAATLMGLTFGAGPCNITCLPYFGPVFVTDKYNQRQIWRKVVPFSAGRLFSYALLGLLAGSFGQVLNKWLASSYVPWILGGATIAVGVSILHRTWQARNSMLSRDVIVNFGDTSVASPSTECQRAPTRMSGGLFFMGVGMALNPCVPLGTVLLAASGTGSISAGLGLGLGFGLGAVIIPALVFAFGVAHFGQQLRLHMQSWQSVAQWGAGILLVLLGLSTVLGWIKP